MSNEKIRFLKPAINKLCLCISIIVLYTVHNGIWQNAIKDLINFSMKSEICFNNGIFILQNIPIELENLWSKINDRVNLEITLAVEFPEIIEFSKNLLLKSEKEFSLENKCKLLKVLANWSKLENLKPFEIPGFKELNLELYKVPELSIKVSKILLHSLEKVSCIPTRDDPTSPEKFKEFFNSEIYKLIIEIIGITEKLLQLEKISVENPKIKKFSDFIFGIAFNFPILFSTVFF